jgi:hypothetical protein
MMVDVVRPPRCICCGGTLRLQQVALGSSTWVWTCSTGECGAVYSGSTFKRPSRGEVFGHPLLRHRHGGEIVGYIRSNSPPTDPQGWMRLDRVTPEST